MSGIEPRKVRRRLRPEDRCTMILAAAGGIFAAQGYERASMREIARVAGVTTPVVYDHFASKADLYGAVIQVLADDLLGHWALQPA